MKILVFDVGPECKKISIGCLVMFEGKNVGKVIESNLSRVHFEITDDAFDSINDKTVPFYGMSVKQD